MPWLFFCFSFLSATFTWNVFQPVFSPAVPATLSFFAGWLTSELALLHILWQALVAAAFIGAGGLGAWPGGVAVGLLFASWCGLIVTQARARGSRDGVMAALADGLGADYEQRTDAALRAGGVAVSIAQLLRPFRIAHPSVEVVRDLVFHEEGRLRLRLDVYRRRERPAVCPMLIYVHGGAWVIGDKEHQGLPLLNHFAARGWVCATINYRLSPRATFPDHLVDVKRAIAWVRAHAVELGGDPDFIVIAGGSAGGHLASLAALTPSDPEYQPGFESADTTVQGCVSFYGIYDFLDRHGHWPNPGMRGLLESRVMKSSPDFARDAWDRASPMARVNANAPPFLCVHGTHDTMVPIDDARRFVDALRAVSRQPVALLMFAGAQHAFEIFPSQRTAISLDAVERFLGFVRSAAYRARPGVAVG